MSAERFRPSQVGDRDRQSLRQDLCLPSSSAAPSSSRLAAARPTRRTRRRRTRTSTSSKCRTAATARRSIRSTRTSSRAPSIRGRPRPRGAAAARGRSTATRCSSRRRGSDTAPSWALVDSTPCGARGTATRRSPCNWARRRRRPTRATRTTSTRSCRRHPGQLRLRIKDIVDSTTGASLGIRTYDSSAICAVNPLNIGYSFEGPQISISLDKSDPSIITPHVGCDTCVLAKP